MIFSLFRAWDKERVVTYTVHEHGKPVSDRIDRAEQLVFVKDGFNYSAALFAPVWLLVNGLWLAFAGYIAVAALIVAGSSWLGLGELWPSLGFLGLHLLIGAEADTLRRFALELSGWKTVGTVVGRNEGECERRFFDTWLSEQPMLRRDETSMGSATAGGMAHPSRLPDEGSRRWWPFGK